MRDPNTLVKDAVSLLRNNYKLLLAIAAVPTILQYIVGLLDASIKIHNPIVQLAFSVLAFAVILASLFTAIAMTLAVDNPQLTIGQAYKQALKFFWRYIGMAIVVMIALSVAYLLLIIPGIILSVWVSFAAFVLILEDGKIIDSLKKSREYVRGRWWSVFGRLVAAMLMFLVLMIITTIPLIWLNEAVVNLLFTVLNIFLLPLGTSYVYFMYQDAKSESGQVESNPPVQLNPESKAE